MAYISLKTVKLLATEFEKKHKGHTVEKFCHRDDIAVYLLDDSLAILVLIVGYKCSLFLNSEQMYGYYRIITKQSVYRQILKAVSMKRIADIEDEFEGYNYERINRDISGHSEGALGFLWC